MRKLVLNLAVSLDGFIEGPNGEYDWCFTDQDYGMTAFFQRVDSVFMGRMSYELVNNMSEADKALTPKLKEYIFSNTLTEVNQGVTLINGDIVKEVTKIKEEKGKDIWLFGGAGLIGSMLNLGLVDELSLAVHPILLGNGKTLVENLRRRTSLQLIGTKAYSSGLVTLNYSLALD